VIKLIYGILAAMVRCATECRFTPVIQSIHVPTPVLNEVFNAINIVLSCALVQSLKLRGKYPLFTPNELTLVNSIDPILSNEPKPTLIFDLLIHKVIEGFVEVLEFLGLHFLAYGDKMLKIRWNSDVIEMDVLEQYIKQA